MSPGKKKGLGRGLSALFGDQNVVEKPNEIQKINKIAISDLSRNPYQPREIFDETKLVELTNSIKKNGITRLTNPIIANQYQSFEKASILIFLK